MKKNAMYLVGGLAVLGAGYYVWKQNKKKECKCSEDEYSNATGKLTRCKRPDGTYYTTTWKQCINGAIAV
jgi:hypothetical protein